MTRETKKSMIEELDVLLNAPYFKTKPALCGVLEVFRKSFKAGKFEALSADAFIEQYKVEGKGASVDIKKDWVASTMNQLRNRLEEFYSESAAHGRRLELADWKTSGKGKYALQLVENSKPANIMPAAKATSQPRLSSSSEDAKPSSPVADPGAHHIVEATAEAKPSGLAEHLVFEIRGGTRLLKRMMWASRIVALVSFCSLFSIGMVLVLGLDVWPHYQGLGLILLASVVASCIIFILAMPLRHVEEVPFGRWWHNIFYAGREGRLSFARYSGTCAEPGCGGALAILPRQQKGLWIRHEKSPEWEIVCRNVPSFHPRAIWDFTQTPAKNDGVPELVDI